MPPLHGICFAYDVPPPPTKRDPKEALQSDTFWIPVGLLVTALILGAVVVAAVDRWRKRSRPFDAASVEEMTHVREMFEAGEITHNEYERIRSKMSGRVKETVGLRPEPAGPADTPQPGNPT